MKAECSCDGSGYVYSEGSYRMCVCRIRTKALEYLAPHYSDARTLPSFKPESWNKSLAFVGPLSVFQSHAKSFLLFTGMRHSHITVQPYDIIQRMVAPPPSPFPELKSTDLLVINFISDPNNRQYGPVIASLLDARHLARRITWVYSRRPLDSDYFVSFYSAPLSRKLLRNLPLLTIS